VSKQYRQDSIKDILDELDRESARIVISKEIRGDQRIEDKDRYRRHIQRRTNYFASGS
jgi:hypothetical protein